MNKSIREKKKLLTPEKAASFIPVFISSTVSLLIVVFYVMPQYYNSNKVSFELNELIKKKNDLDNLKSQYKKINEKFDELNKEKSRIIELITGKSKLDTLLAKLGEIGKKNNIEFTSIIPKKLSKASEISVDKNKNKNKSKRKNIKEVNLKIDPLLVEGTKKYEFDFYFKSDFVNLLSFLRELEFQDNAILINNINISEISESSGTSEIDNTNEILEVNIGLTFYGRT